MQAQSALIVVMLILVFAINITSAVVWLRLLYLVRSADEILSFRTASMYTRYLFGQAMAGKFFRPSTVTLGNPEKDPVIRAVKGSASYQRVLVMASYVKDLPVNVVPFLV